MGEQFDLFDRGQRPTAPSLLASTIEPLPERVRVMSMWHEWAAAVAACADGHPEAKSIETRDWPLPYPSESYPSRWLAIHASQRANGPVPGRVEPFPKFPPVQPGALCALVYVAACRPLVPEDRAKALRYHPDVYAWELRYVRRLAPVPMRGPQKFGSVDRNVVVKALLELSPSVRNLLALQKLA
jgi:hypothetical protein